MEIYEYKEGYLRIVAKEGKVLLHLPTLRTYHDAIVRKEELNNWEAIDA